MTNIMAIVKNKGTHSPDVVGDNSLCYENVGVVMADGLASDGVEVSGGNQKVISVGSNFVLGTGASDFIVDVARQTSEWEKLNPSQIAQNILNYTRKHFTFQPAEQLNFIVAGKNENELEIYYVPANRIKKPIFVDRKMSIDGSGSVFVRKAAERDFQRGHIIDPGYESLADIALRLFDFSYVATKSAGVNEEFQYGFFFDGKTATLMHPNVFMGKLPKEYCDEQGNFSKPKKSENDEFYKDLAGKMVNAYQLQNKHNMLASMLREGVNTDIDRSLQMLKEKSFELTKAKSELNKMIGDYVLKHNQPTQK